MQFCIHNGMDTVKLIDKLQLRIPLCKWGRLTKQLNAFLINDNDFNN
jgi:hypothetical protein